MRATLRPKMDEPQPRQTEIVAVDPAAPDSAAIARAAAVLRAGGLVAFPTETVYGLGADALSAAAVRAIFAAKGRPAFNPLIVHVPDTAAARELVASWPELAARAAAEFWPGPLTLVLPKRAVVPDEVTAGLDTVGVRVPSHPVALALLREAAVPIAAPSANLFTRLSPTTAAHVIAALNGLVDVVIDGGATPFGIESTVLDLSGPQPELLRPGIIGIHELEPVVGPIAAVPASAAGAAVGGEVAGALRSPGMLERHYSPAARIVVFDSPDDGAQAAVLAHAAGQRVGALVRHSYAGPADEVLLLPDDAGGYARLLYASLHALDEAGCDVVLVEAVPHDAKWAAVRDRLARAAG
jgi:L-threonylcarbamoyladenylate synthase